MNYASMTPKEVLNYAEPKTDLEVALFQIASDLQDENIGLQNELRYAEDWVNYEDEANDLRDEKEGLMRLISDAVGLIHSGKIQDAVNKLESA